MDIDLSLIESICASYAAMNIYTADNIPQKKLQNAIQCFPLTNASKVYMLYDDTMFGSCKNGIAVCDNGVFYKNDALHEPRYRYFSWEEFATLNIHLEGESICFGDYYQASAASALKRGQDIMIEMFQKLQEAVSLRKFMTESHQETVQNFGGRWMLAVDGKQFGPIGTEEIKEKIISGSIKPNITFLWKQGMGQWELLVNIQEFKGTLDKQVFEGLTPVPPPINMETNKASNQTGGGIDINNCTLDELLVLDCIDLQKARLLIDVRDKGKKFYTAEDVGMTLELKPHELEEIKDKAVFTVSETSRKARRVEF